MKTPKRPPLESLHHALKSWDPVRREGVPSAEEVARWRRRMLAVEAERRRTWRFRWRPALATLAAVLALVVLREDGRRPPPPPPVERPAGRVAAGPGLAGRTGAASGEEGSAPQGGTVAGMPTAGPAEPGASARGEQAGDEAGGRAGERVSRTRRHAAASPEGRRPSAVEPLAEDRPEETADRAGTPWGDSPLPEERTAADSAEEAQQSAGMSAAVGPAESASSGPPLAVLPPTLPSRGPAAAAAPPAPPAFREVQIIAPGGTRIVWLIAADPVPTGPSSQEDT